MEARRPIDSARRHQSCVPQFGEGRRLYRANVHALTNNYGASGGTNGERHRNVTAAPVATAGIVAAIIIIITPPPPLPPPPLPPPPSQPTPPQARQRAGFAPQWALIRVTRPGHTSRRTSSFRPQACRSVEDSGVCRQGVVLLAVAGCRQVHPSHCAATTTRAANTTATAAAEPTPLSPPPPPLLAYCHHHRHIIAATAAATTKTATTTLTTANSAATAVWWLPWRPPQPGRRKDQEDRWSADAGHGGAGWSRRRREPSANDGEIFYRYTSIC